MMFVYGSLRPGEYNSVRTGAEDAAEVLFRNVRIKGRMKPVSHSGGYPVVDVLTETDSTIEGDILMMDADGDEYFHIMRMETGAGYVPVAVTVDVDGNQVACLVWHYVGFDELSTEIVKSGDWIQWQRAGGLQLSRVSNY